MIGEKKKQVVFMGSDHAGFQVKSKLHEFLKGKGFDVSDLGCFSEDTCDYPDIAREVGEKVMEHPDAFGILICGSGVGVAMAANKIKGVRAAMANNEELAELSRRHNNANVLTMGARTTDQAEMEKITMKFLETAFESDQERHVRRVEKINNM